MVCDLCLFVNDVTEPLSSMGEQRGCYQPRVVSNALAFKRTVAELLRSAGTSALKVR